jgi:SNF2 family DNA or RNA helicase
MGMGKTLTAIAGVIAVNTTEIKYKGLDPKHPLGCDPTLFVVPSSLRRVWISNLQENAPDYVAKVITRSTRSAGQSRGNMHTSPPAENRLQSRYSMIVRCKRTQEAPEPVRDLRGQ